MEQGLPQIGEIVRTARKAKGYTQADVSRIVKITLKTIQSIELDRRYPTFDVLCRLIYALNINAEQLFGISSPVFSVAQEQTIRELSSCDEHSKRIIFATLSTLIREFRKT